MNPIIMKLFRKKQKAQSDLLPKQVEQNETPVKKQKKKQRRTVHCICDECLCQFTAHRSDAKFCSAACRQRAHINGGGWGYTTNPAEHFLMRTLQRCIKTLVEKEGLYVYRHELKTWIDQSAAVRMILFYHINDDNYLKVKYTNELDAFYDYIKVSNSKNVNDPIYYSIPTSLKNEWVRFLGALE